MLRRMLLIALASSFGCCWLGCTRSAPPAGAYDRSAARETLVAALDAWQRGQGGQLAQRQPPIRFADDDFRSGSRLVAYELAEADGLFGPHQDVPVKLTLLDRRGRTVTKSVSYQITLSPGLAVLRTDS